MDDTSMREAAIFGAARRLTVEERARYLDGACAGDALLRGQIEELLKADESAGAFLAELAAGAGGPVRGGAGLDSEATLVAAPGGSEQPGDTIDRYKLLENVGEGGFGVVYVAEQKEPVKRRVALKIIKLGMDTKAVVARFEAERQALAMMDHPNIAKVLDAGTTQTGRPYFVMELVRGIRITDYCDEANLSTRQRLDLFIQVCQAIQHAHQKGIIHRDIKPSNILVTLHDGVPVPKVIDFGIAKATEGRLTDATVYTQLHQFIGTPAYMSPEQAEMSGLDIDTRSDIYSLGVLLYELLVGSTPFDAKELMASGIEAMRKTIREQEPVRPSTRLAALPGEKLTTTAKRRSVEASRLVHLLRGDLDWIVMKCLEKDRSRRYETANGLAADLKRHLNHEPVVARPPSAAYRFQKAVRRNRVAFTAAGAVVVALVVGLTVSIWETVLARKAQRETEVARKGEQQQRVQAQSALQIAEAEKQRADAQARKATESQQQSRRLLYAADMNLAQQALGLNNLGKARRLLDRHRPRPGEEDLRGWEWRYLWQLTRSSALVTLTNRPASGLSVSFSPDGTLLAVGWIDAQVDLWDVPGRRRIRVLTDRGDLPRAYVAFSPVRKLLAAVSQPKVVTLYDFESGRESVLWRAPDQDQWIVRNLSFSPDGSRLVIYARGTPKLGDAAWVVNVSSANIESRHTTDFSAGTWGGVARISPDNRRLYLGRSDASKLRYSIQCVDLATGQELWQTAPQRDWHLTAMAISPDGLVLATGSGYADPSIRLWNPATGSPLGRLEGHTAGWISELKFSKDGRRLLSAASDQTIRLWDASNWTETQVLRGHHDEVLAAAISDSAELIASASKDGDLTLWKAAGRSAADGYRLLPEDHWDDQVWPLDHSRLLLLPSGRRPEWVDLNPNSSPGPLPEIGFTTNVLGWFGTNILCHWNGTNRILVHELHGSELIQRAGIAVDSGSRPSGVAYNATRQLLAWTEGASSNLVHLASLAATSRRIELRGDVPGLTDLRFSEAGNYLAAATQDQDSERVWDVETGQVVASINERLSDVVFAVGGRVLVAAYQRGVDHEIGFHDLAHPDQAPRRVPGKDRPARLAVSPDGGLVASANMSGRVLLFDPLKGELIETLHGHLNGAYGVAFSADGRRLISASGGREAVKLWDVGTRQELLTLSGTGSAMWTAGWSADGEVILAGAPAQAWRAPSWEEIDAAEAKEKAGSAVTVTSP